MRARFAYAAALRVSASKLILLNVPAVIVAREMLWYFNNANAMTSKDNDGSKDDDNDDVDDDSGSRWKWIDEISRGVGVGPCWKWQRAGRQAWMTIYASPVSSSGQQRRISGGHGSSSVVVGGGRRGLTYLLCPPRLNMGGVGVLWWWRRRRRKGKLAQIARNWSEEIWYIYIYIYIYAFFVFLQIWKLIEDKVDTTWWYPRKYCTPLMFDRFVRALLCFYARKFLAKPKKTGHL